MIYHQLLNTLTRRLWLGVFVVLCVMSVLVLRVTALGDSQTSLTFSITNSYTGSISIVSTTGIWLMDQNSMIRTNQSYVRIAISANKTSQYLLSGGYQGGVIAGDGIDQYVHHYDLALSTGVVRHDLSAQFMSSYEPLTAVLQSPIMVDQLAPSMSDLLVENGTVMTGDILFHWSPSVDTGVGISHYIVFMGLTPSVSSMVGVIATGTSLGFSSSDVPYGTLYWTVVAIDYLGNQSEYRMGYIHHMAVTEVQSQSTSSQSTSSQSTSSQSTSSQSTSSQSTSSQSTSSQSTSSQSTSSQSTSSHTLLDDRTALISDSSIPSVPIYFVDHSGKLHASAPHCPGLRVSQLRYCHERDLLNTSFAARDNKGIIWDDFSSFGSATTSRTEVKKGYKTAWDDFIVRVIYRDIESQSVGQDRREMITRITTPIVFIPTAPQGVKSFSKVLYYRYHQQAPAGWTLPTMGTVASSPLIQSVSYDHIIAQYGENSIPYTKTFTRYIIFMISCMGLMSMWFFARGYHHHAIIKYLK